MFLATKDELLISTFRERPGAFLLLDILVHLTQLSFVILSFSGSNLSSLTASDSFSSFCICKCTFQRLCFSLLSLCPSKKLFASHFKSMRISITICHIICKSTYFRSLCPPRSQAPLGASVPGIQLAARCSVHTNPKEQTILQTMLAGRLDREYYPHYIERGLLKCSGRFSKHWKHDSRYWRLRFCVFSAVSILIVPIVKGLST